jgi:general secretion pathway protein A
MYKKFFELKENPFNINPDPRYLLLTESIREALACLTYGIHARKGFILLTGEVGTGKTTLLNKILEWSYQQGFSTAFVFNPRLSVPEFFDFVMADFGIPCESSMKSQVLLKLHQWLLERYRAGKRVVLIVDEAQNLSSQMLEEIRLLTNLETSSEKLLQIILSGQPELERKLTQPELRQLRQRITLRAKTCLLTLEDTRGYITERLRIAGSNGEEIFTPEAIQAVHRFARGIPRITNLLCEHGLIGAFVDQRKPVPQEIIEEVARDFDWHEINPLAQALPDHAPNGDGQPLVQPLQQAISTLIARLNQVESAAGTSPPKTEKEQKS